MQGKRQEVFGLYAGLMAPPKVGVDVVVAANDIQVGVKIEDSDLKVMKYPPKTCLAVSFIRKHPQSGAAQCFPSGRENLWSLTN